MPASSKMLAYQPLPPPQLDGDRKLYIKQELDRIRRSLNTMIEAIEELQAAVFP